MPRFHEEATSSDAPRPILERVLLDCASPECRGLVVAKLDRLGRSIYDVSKIMETAQDEGWHLLILDPAVDTTTLMGRAMVQMAAVFAELERGLIAERTAAALAHARDLLAQEPGNAQAHQLLGVALQRTGKLGTYASCLGHEAAHIGIGSAMQYDDVFAPSYREYGAQFMRGVRPRDVLMYWGGDERGNDFSGPPHDYPWYYGEARQPWYDWDFFSGQVVKREVLKTDGAGRAAISIESEIGAQDLEYRIEAGSARKPNKDRDAQNIGQAFLGIDAALRIYSNIVPGLVVYPEVIRRHVEEELPFMATENILMAARNTINTYPNDAKDDASTRRPRFARWPNHRAGSERSGLRSLRFSHPPS